ncbi:MAG: VirB4 family type IV secretion/conjugal transfer ATPase [Rickettsiaceae bacterium]
MKLFKTRAAKEFYDKKETHISKFIQYRCHWDHNTIVTKKYELLQVVKLNGISFETKDDQDLDIRLNLLNSFLKTLASGNIILYFHVIRQRKPVISDDMVAYNFVQEPNIHDDFFTYLSQSWYYKHVQNQSFHNDLYISILYRPDKGGAAIIEYWLKKIQHVSNVNWEQDMREMKEQLYELTSRICRTFEDYGAQILQVKKSPSGTHFCEILEFLGQILNCGNNMPMSVPRIGIDRYIPNTRLFFGRRSIEARNAKSTKYAGIVSVLEYSPRTNAGILDGFLQMPFPFIMTQSFIFANRTIAINKMQLQQNRMIQAEDKAVSQISEINQALDMAMSGTIGFGSHHLSILCIDDNLKALENSLSIASVELSNHGFKPIRETVNIEASYWGQLPGNYEYIARKSMINTLNLAGFNTMHNYPTGKISGNHWGEYVTILDTTSGTPFYFNFHVRDVGHTLIIGPTGAGKTLLMNFLCAKSLKFKPRIFFFDKDHGAEIFLRSIYGVYTVLDPSVKCNFNPLQLDDTGTNRTFLMEWLRLLVTSNGEIITSEENKILEQAIDGNFRLNKKDRKLSNIVAFLGIDGPGTLASRISMWYGIGAKANIFDNDTDDIDLSSASVFGFEMAQLLKDKISLGPVLLYIFHRINSSLDGARTIIVLDEAWSLIDNDIFAPKIKDWLKVLRKLNTFVIFATQSVEDAAKSKISDTLIQQTATQIFLPNLKATDVYRSAFMLSQREYMLIKTTNPGSHYFLIKQNIDSVIAKLDLTGMTNVINVLSGRIGTIELLRKLIKKYGADPEDWLQVFYQQSKTIA